MITISGGPYKKNSTFRCHSHVKVKVNGRYSVKLFTQHSFFDLITKGGFRTFILRNLLQLTFQLPISMTYLSGREADGHVEEVGAVGARGHRRRVQRAGATGHHGWICRRQHYSASMKEKGCISRKTSEKSVSSAYRHITILTHPTV